MSTKHILLSLALLHVSIACTADDNGANCPEIRALLSETRPAEQERLVKDLVARVGPETAQDELLHSGLPFTGETHLIAHTVGSEIYKKFGARAILRCRPYFLGACYHGFLIEAVGDHGEEGITDSWQQCRNAGVSIQYGCAHAIGHGLMAQRHSILSALTECDSLSTSLDGFPPSNCYDGVFMENIWKVHHGHLSHEISPVSNDLSYPCDDPGIQPKYQPACWRNQVAVLLKGFQGDLAKIAEKCRSLRDTTNEDYCFDGLAREIQTMANGNAETAFRLCSAAAERQISCVITNAEAAFALGDHNKFPFEICSLIDDDGGRGKCYDGISSYIAGEGRYSSAMISQICGELTKPSYVKACVADKEIGSIPTKIALPKSGARSDQKVKEIQDPYSYPVPYSYPNPYSYPTPYSYPVPYYYPVPYPTPNSSPQR